MGSTDFAWRLPSRNGPAAPQAASDRSSELVAQLGSEVASALSKALERVNALATTGRIDRSSLRALREEIELARRTGMMAQQVGRLASGRLRVTNEALDLAALLREAMVQRNREIDARGIEVREVLRPAWVQGDATLTFSLIQTALDWSFEHACSRIDVEIEHRSWPAQAQLVVAYAHRPADEVTSGPMPLDAPTLDTMSWRLLAQTAVTLGLPLVRNDSASRTKVTIDFPRTLADPQETLAKAASDEAADTAPDSKPLVGSHVLVVAARREVRNLVRETLRPMGLMLDFVASVDEASEFCAGGLPHAIVHESTLGEAFERLRQEWLLEVPTLAFIQIGEDNHGFEVRSAGGREFSSVGRSAIVESLPAALMFELSRCG